VIDNRCCAEDKKVWNKKVIRIDDVWVCLNVLLCVL